MVRSSFTAAALRASGRGRRGECLHQPIPLRRIGAEAPGEEIAAIVDPQERLPRAGYAAEIVARDAVKAIDLPAVDRPHQVPRKALGYLHGPCSAEPLLVQRRRERMNTGPRIGHRDGPDDGAEYEPRGRLVLFRRRRPSHPPAADQPAVNPDRVWPVDRDDLVWRRIGAKSIRERDHAGIERAPRCAQGLVRLEHHGKFCKIEPSDINQRTGAAFGCNAASVGKGISALAQPDEREWWRQMNRFHQGIVAGLGRPQAVLHFPFLPDREYLYEARQWRESASPRRTVGGLFGAASEDRPDLLV
jgi:hypothetical protein